MEKKIVKDHRHIKSNHPDFKANGWECVCGYKTKKRDTFLSHVGVHT